MSDPRGERLPEARDASDGEQFGRGPAIVGMLAGQWGVCPRLGVGKTVRAAWGPVTASGAAFGSSALAGESR